MAFGAEFLIPAAIGAAGVATGVAASALIKPKTPPMPQITMPEIPTIDPVSPPNAPLNPSLTAAAQKARARMIGNQGNKDIVLSGRGARSTREEDPTNLVTRKTLLGR